MICNLVQSSNLKEVCYDDHTATLDIEFHGGGKYRYIAVPRAAYLGLMQASSHGKYFAQYIKGHYTYFRIG